MPVRNLSRIAAAVALAFGLSAASASAQPAMKHVRGTLASVESGSIDVTTSSGRRQAVATNDATGLFLVSPAGFGDITANRFVGVTSEEKDGKQVAREVHVFAEDLRGLGEGHYPWDLDSADHGDNSMTNANIGKVETVGGDRVIKLDYKDGAQSIVVPPGTPVVKFDKTTKDKLAVGAKVFVIAKPAEDGKLLAAAVVIGADGLKPPM